MSTEILDEPELSYLAQSYCCMYTQVHNTPEENISSTIHGQIVLPTCQQDGVEGIVELTAYATSSSCLLVLQTFSMV